MLNTLKRIPAIWGAAGALVLIIGLTRCSPIAPSVNKHALTTQNAQNVDALLLASRMRVLLFKTRLMDGDSFRDLIARLNDASKVSKPGSVLINLSDSQLSEIRIQRKTLIQLGGLVPTEATALIGVSLPRRTLLDDAVMNIDTSLKPVSVSGGWALSFPLSGDADRDRAADLVLSNIEQIAIQVIDPAVAANRAGAVGATGATGSIN